VNRRITAIATSTAAVAPALIGMGVGQLIRAKTDQDTFRLLFQIGLLLVGGDLVARSVV
jgi:hypothetical protein